jgi:hypothetical protein
MDFTTKDGTKVYGAVLSGKNFKLLYSDFNNRYFGNSLPDISVYSCATITPTDHRPTFGTFGLTTLPGDTIPDLGAAIFIAEPNAGWYGWQTMVHEMVHVQLMNFDHTPEFWAALRLIVDKHYLELMGIPEIATG